MRRFILIGLLFISSAAVAQPATPLSMQSCIDYALKHNFTLKNAQLDILIQKAQVDQTVSAAYPHINGKLELDDFLNPQQSIIDGKYFGAPGTKQKIAFTLPYSGTASVSGSQVIFDGSVFVALQARKTVMEFANLTGKVTEETVRYNVYKSYNSLVIAYRQYDIIKKSLSFARSLEHDVQVTQEIGFAERIDVERTSVQVNNLATDSIRIGNMLTLAEQVLKYTIGMDINAPIVLTDTAIDERKEKVLALLTEQEKYERVPEYNMATTGLKLNEFNLKRYKLSALPSLSAFGSMGYNYPSAVFSDLFHFPNYLFNSMIGLQLNVPIFNGFARLAQVNEAKLNIEKTQNNIENLKLGIDFQTAQARTSLRNAVLQVQSQHRNMDVANDVLDLAQKKYKGGVGSNLEVTQAQTDQLRAQTNYFNALLDIINSEADLRKALGLLK